MQQRKYIDFLNLIEKLKCNTRHSWTSSGRQESVAEHSWRLAVMAMLCADEYPDLDINKSYSNGFANFVFIAGLFATSFMWIMLMFFGK